MIDTYDKDHKLSYDSFPEKYQTLQWVMFQVSGQGPYYGQAAWFINFHHEKLPSAIERYIKEMERVVSVIDLHLSKTKSEYLVGNKVTYADLMFIPWAQLVGWVDKEGKILSEGKYPHYQAWYKKITERPGVAKVLEEKAKKMQQH